MDSTPWYSIREPLSIKVKVIGVSGECYAIVLQRKRAEQLMVKRGAVPGGQRGEECRSETYDYASDQKMQNGWKFYLPSKNIIKVLFALYEYQ
jgi:hypothetical protein